MKRCERYFDEISSIAVSIDSDAVERLLTELVQLWERRRRFCQKCQRQHRGGLG